MPAIRDSAFPGRRFLLFFISQNLVACGAFFQVVAVAALLADMTGSGLLTGLSVVSAPLPGILLALFAGSLGDRFQARKLLVFFDLLRGCLVLLFVFCRTVPAVFAVMMLVSLVDVLYSPAKNKMLTTVAEGGSLLRANALLNGGYGAVSLAAPLLSGLLTGVYGVGAAFTAGSVLYLLSSLLLSTLGINGIGECAPGRTETASLAEGLRYCRGNAPLKRAVLTSSVADFGTACVNIAFYALAFDTLKVTSGYWGLLLSVLYGMNLVSMLVLLHGRRDSAENPLARAQLLLLAVPVVWCFYSLVNNRLFLLAGAAAEGLLASLAGTFLLTAILQAARPEFTARAVGVRDLASSAAKLAGIGLTYPLLMHFGAGVVFVAAGAAVFSFTLIQIVFVRRRVGTGFTCRRRVN